MSKNIIIPLLLLFAFALWGCPYESEVPVDEPGIRINEEWFGLWKRPGEEKSYASLSKYKPTDTLSYRLVYNSWTSEHRSYEVKMFKAFLSKVDETYFMNIQPEMKMGGNFFLFGISCNATIDTLRLRPVNEENAPRFTDSPSLREWIKKQLVQKNFFDAEELFVREKQ